MSKLSFRPVGGLNGIELRDNELDTFNGGMGLEQNLFVPLPHGTTTVQFNKAKGCQHEDTQYWEKQNGQHGWCCSDCGLITQWG